MRDLMLQCAGVAGIAVALIHGVLGETKVFARATIQPESLRTLIRLVWQAGYRGVDRRRRAADRRALVGIGERAALDRRHDRRGLRLCRAANAWWSRGRGFGWKALSAVVALAVAGY